MLTGFRALIKPYFKAVIASGLGTLIQTDFRAMMLIIFFDSVILSGFRAQ